jgi:chemotaxis methyl-accepting protein methylase
VTPADYEFLRKLLKDRSGLDLSADKQYLVESRLVPLARRAGLPGLPELVQKLRSTTDALTTDIRAMVQHRQLNLLQDFSHLGAFDVIFCRNVLIYFDQDTKANIFGRLARVLEPDGYLLLGAAETVVGLTESFKPCPERRGLYRSSAAPMPRLTTMPHELKVASGR